MKMAIVGGGPKAELVDLHIYNQEDILWIGVDRGAAHLLDEGITPDAAFGDFDSVSRQELASITEHTAMVRTYPSEKDETDLELALNWAIGQSPEAILLFGVTGGRLDHFYGTMSLLTKKEFLHADTRIEVVDRFNNISFHLPGSHSLLADAKRKYCSFFPVFHDVAGFTLEGFKYPLTDHTLQAGTTLSVSNQLIGDEGTFSFTDGIIMMIRSTDE